MERRREEIAGVGQRSRAAAHQAYGTAIRNGQDLTLRQPSDLASHGAAMIAKPPKPRQAVRVTPGSSKPSSVGHPGLAESLIPVWGSGREALADYQDGDYLGAGLNGALAVSDLFPAADIAKAVGKGGFYAIRGPLFRKAKDQTWKAVSGVMHTPGPFGVEMLRDGYEGHHWLIPNNRWGKAFPDWLKNHPLNINELKETTHRRIHTRYKGKPRFGPVQRTWVGIPSWAKASAVEAVARPAAELEKRGRRR
jgi:hypothetical protein